MKIQRLLEYVKKLRDDHPGKDIYGLYQEDILKAKPEDLFEVFSRLLSEGEGEEDILGYLDKTINAFYRPLTDIPFTIGEDMDFLLELDGENRALELHMDGIRDLIRGAENPRGRIDLIKKIGHLEDFFVHYLKKENILFPYLEKKNPRFEGLSIMWHLHDKIRKNVKDAPFRLAPECSTQSVYGYIAELFFDILGMKSKEELILFPTALDLLDEPDWEKMHKDSLSYDIAFEGKRTGVSPAEDTFIETAGTRFVTNTGSLSSEEIFMIFKNLGCDITYVDENDRVKYYSEGENRIFPRSPAVIGRNVKNCHPPGSVHVVENIIDSFKKGLKNEAVFWINMKGRVIMIKYFPLRDSSGKYRGVLEVSQDITDHVGIRGERRILDWEK